MSYNTITCDRILQYSDVASQQHSSLSVLANQTQSPIQYDSINFKDYWFCSQEYYIHNMLKTWAPPLMIVSGSVGNAIAFIVLSRRNIRKWSICIYLAVFALCNTLVLYVGCGLDWVAHITETPYVANLADWICRLWQFVFNVIIYTASWVVVAMISDRFVSVCLPTKAKLVCTVFISKLVCILIVVFLIVISIHAMWTYELTPNGCYIDPAQRDFQSISWPYISAILYSYVPLTSITVLIVAVLCSYVNSTTVALELPSNASHQSSFTRAAVIISSLYVIMSLPTVVINFVEYNRPDWSSNYKKLAQIFLARTIGQSIACLCHSISYIVYFTTVPLFRAELVRIIKKLCVRTHSSTDSDINAIHANGETKHEDFVTTLL